MGTLGPPRQHRCRATGTARVGCGRRGDAGSPPRPRLKAEREPLGWEDEPWLPGPIRPPATHHETAPADAALRANSSGLRSCLSRG